MTFPRVFCPALLPALLALAGSFLLPHPLAAAPSQPALSATSSLTPARIQERLALEFNPDALLRAAKDLTATFPDRCPLPSDLEARLAQARTRLPALFADLKSADPAKLQAACKEAEDLLAFSRSLLLANPLLDFDRILLIRRTFPGAAARHASSGDLGFVPGNFFSPLSIPRKKWENEIALLSQLRGSQAQLETVFKSGTGELLRDMQLEFDGNRLAFSMRGESGPWAIQELSLDENARAQAPKQLTPNEKYPDIDFYGPCYLPDGKMLLSSNASYQGLPCIGGGSPIANLYLLSPPSSLRQIAFDQDSDSYPSLLPDGRVMFLRWEYSDLPHYFSRRVMAMNPDGTSQSALYGSNSQFPTTFLYPKAIPGHPSQIVGVLGGHHDIAECGRMALLDPDLARSYPFRFHPQTKEWGEEGKPIDLVPEVLPAEKTGFIQTIPGYGKPVVAHVCDGANIVAFKKEISSLFAHPYPLSGKYFLAAMKPKDGALWGIYLVDVFDNQTLLAEVEGSALLEPVPFKSTKRPPMIPDRIQPENPLADVRIADIYNGPGLQGVPRGTVKSLRVFAYHFPYHHRGGHDSVGLQSSWDIKRILGEATVEEDGSAFFQIPANTPVSLQPLDSQGRAVQLMRSWFVGMPGEHVSCIGCHEERRSAVVQRRTLADRHPAQPLRLVNGGPRPFAFTYEVYPVLEKNCIPCHTVPATIGPRSKPCFKDPQTAYNTLHPYIHRPGPEADSALPVPMEYHASTSPLIRMLETGHHGVTLAGLDAQSRQQFYRWIDLNAPFKGAWAPPVYNTRDQRSRRCELTKEFANITADPEGEYSKAMAEFNQRPKAEPKAAGEAARKEPAQPTDDLKAPPAPAASGERKEFDLGNGHKMVFVKIPAGQFVMGSNQGAADERPRSLVKISKPFWMGVTEVTNGEFAQFNPEHDTRYLDIHGKDHPVPGYIANHPNQPVARISWNEAREFCKWFAKKFHLPAGLPTEAQWEWAARAGTQTQFYYGTLESDFSPFANLADQGLRYSMTSFQGGSVLQRRSPYRPDMNFPLHDERFDDKAFVVDYVGQKQANPWGLCDMVGNVSEWTSSTYLPYPFKAEAAEGKKGHKIARGGSWADRPADAGASVRRAYEPWQKVYDVGFRLILEL